MIKGVASKQDCKQMELGPSLAIGAFAFGWGVAILEVQSAILGDGPRLPGPAFAHTIFFTAEKVVWAAFAIVAYCCTRRGAVGFWIATLAIGTAIFVQFSFRSGYVRNGTFDQFEVPAAPWVAPIVLFAFAGASAAAIQNHATGVAPSELRRDALAWSGVAACVASAFLAWSETSWWGMWRASEFPPTRWIALVVLGCGVTSMALIQQMVTGKEQ